MKKVSIRFTFIFTLIMFISSCESFVGGELNRDPNNSSEAPVNLLLPSIQVHLADLVGGEFSRYNGLLVQHIRGVQRSFNIFYNYQLFTNRIDLLNSPWEVTYTSILNELRLLKNQSVANGFNHFEAIGLILEAYTLMLATDVWDDIPYTEAVQGLDNFHPAYDDQNSIYEVIHENLDRALFLLGERPGINAPGETDLFYAGDINAWNKAAHAVKARAYLHFNEYELALNEIDQSFESEADNMGFQYPGGDHPGPYFRFNKDRVGEFLLEGSFKRLLEALKDRARLDLLDHIFDTDHPYFTSTFFQELITYRELLFIKAEIDVRLNVGGSEAGYEAYLDAIGCSFKRLNLPESAYEAYINQIGISPGIGNLTLDYVMTQKYIGLFLDPETYSDWRRTGIPNLLPYSGSEIPVRWPYPEIEHEFNENAPAQGSIDIFEDRVGWNQ